jgi:transcription initiation factor TFIID subunit 1
LRTHAGFDEQQKEEQLQGWAVAEEERLGVMKRDIQIMQHVYEQRIIAPWNLTNNFVQQHLQKKGLLRLQGMGDPSGCGEGFSFLRRPPPPKGKGKEEGNGLDEGGYVKNIKKSGADLRTLTMVDMKRILVGLGMSEIAIDKLPRYVWSIVCGLSCVVCRVWSIAFCTHPPPHLPCHFSWDRVHMIRKLSGEAFRTGHAGALSKYARQGRTTYTVEHVKYTKQCTEIWRRQRRVLMDETVPKGSESDRYVALVVQWCSVCSGVRVQWCSV